MVAMERQKKKPCVCAHCTPAQIFIDLAISVRHVRLIMHLFQTSSSIMIHQHWC